MATQNQSIPLGVQERKTANFRHFFANFHRNFDVFHIFEPTDKILRLLLSGNSLEQALAAPSDPSPSAQFNQGQSWILNR
jgi:hypothetical protein